MRLDDGFRTLKPIATRMSHNPPSSTPSLVPATTALTTLATALAAPAAEPTAVDKAFEALKGYTYGSPRGDLTPLDRAVESAIGDETAKRALEKRLLTALEGNPPAVGKEYIC